MSCGYDLTASLGETFRLTGTYKDGDGVPIDLTGDEIVFTIDGTSYHSDDNLEVQIGSDPGSFHLMLTSTQIDTLGIGIFDYTVVLTQVAFPAGQGDTLLLSGVMQVE